MREMVRGAIRDVDFVLWARDVIRRQGADLRDPKSIANAVQRYIKSHLTFVADPFGVESLAPPLKHMAALKSYGRIAGDCDDAATLSAALGMANGLRAFYTIQAFDWGRGKSPYQHVFTTLASKRFPADRWTVNCDTTRDDQKLPPTVQRKLTAIV